jgi:1-acyl-sn-glycerol-3-phosphate acyltransferase
MPPDTPAAVGDAKPKQRGSRPKRAVMDQAGQLDRSRIALAWYRIVQYTCATFTIAVMGWRATGQSNLPSSGAALLVSNHMSFFDVFALGILARRPLNFVARSTLFVPVLGPLISSVGAFPIQREGMGASGMKETLRRLRSGGIVALFPEGTRSADGELAPLKHGIAVLVSRAGVPVVPVGIAGTFQLWPRWQRLPGLHPVRAHLGPAITPEQLEGMDTAAITELIRQTLDECRQEAMRGLRRDLEC